MNSFLKKISLFLVLCISVVVTEFYIEAYIYNQNILMKVLRLALNLENSTIIFGSSVNGYVAPEDTTYNSISMIVNEEVTDQHIIGISHGAYGPDMYIEFIKKIAKHGTSHTVVVPVNMRYFSPEWDLRPGYQFIKERYKMNWIPHYMNTLNFRKVSLAEFYNHPVYFAGKQVGTVKDFDHNPNIEIPDTAQKLISGFTFHYMQPIDSNNNKLKSLIDICEICKQNNIKLLMYFTPVNVEHAERLGIKGFREHQIRNINIVKNAIKPYNIPYTDVALNFSDSLFHYYVVPNEHLNMHGKRKLAIEIADLIKNN